MALILRYFTQSVFHRIRVQCHVKTTIKLAAVSKLLLIVYDRVIHDYLGKTNSDNSV